MQSVPACTARLVHNRTVVPCASFKPLTCCGWAAHKKQCAASNVLASVNVMTVPESGFTIPTVSLAFDNLSRPDEGGRHQFH